jgi:acyl-CoA synthetase (NDP forming)/GNAT superfamily N-acetyltransferase
MDGEAGRNVGEAARSVYALLADGTTAEIRPAAPDDFDAVKSMHEAMSPDNAYLRFFGLSRTAAADEARRTCLEGGPGHVALLALADGVLAGCASYHVLRPSAGQEEGTRDGVGDVAEIAFAVADSMHHRGIATLLLEHLVSVARNRQVRAFTAETLTENTAMLRVFAEAGLPVLRHRAGEVIEMTFPLPRDGSGTALDTYLNAVARRERVADAASLRHALAPESVVVIGAGRRRGSVGRAVLDNIRSGGFGGRVYAINPHTPQIDGERCLPSVADLPEPADLAVIAVPAAAVLDLADQCGRHGVRSLVVITSGLSTATSADLLAVCRRYGMRLIGPNCFGVAVPAIGLDATFAAAHPRPGVAGLVTQSGGLGFAMVEQLSRLGIGISSFVSVGNKLDVSSNDMLLWWEQDSVTRLAVLYIESFGNPRKFARTARRVGAAMPVLTVHAGRSAAGQQAAASHSAAVAAPLASREALFEQAGVIATPGFGELIEATALLATQPVPAGRSVAIVSNVGGAGVLTADACTDLGLTVHHPRGQTSSRLRALLPHGGTVSGPVDTTAAVTAADFRQCLELLAAEEDVDAIIALVLPTAATGDLVTALQEADVRVPLAAVVLNQAESVRLLPRSPGRAGTDGAGQVPAYGYPEAAAAALARAARYGIWRGQPRGRVPDFPDLKAADAQLIVHGFLRQAPGGGRLPPGETRALLACYGIPLAGLTSAASENAATGGTEVIIGVINDDIFGPLVVFGPGGAGPEAPADRAARLTPLTDTDADGLIRSSRSAPLLLGHRGAPAADLTALRDLLLRVSRLADDLPEVTDLDLKPVIARPDGVFALAAQIKAAPCKPQDPFLRRLR